MRPAVHAFHIQVAKLLFWSPRHGFVMSVSPIRVADAERMGLEPVLLYTLENEEGPNRLFQVSRQSQPLDPLHFLNMAWRDIPAFSGKPVCLQAHSEIVRRLPGLCELVRRGGAQVVMAPGTDKRFAAKLRGAHNEARKWLWHSRLERAGVRSNNTLLVHDASVLNGLFRATMYPGAFTRTSAGHPSGEFGSDGTLPGRLPAEDTKALQTVFAIGQSNIPPRDGADLVTNPGSLPILLGFNQRPNARYPLIERLEAGASRLDDGARRAGAGTRDVATRTKTERSRRRDSVPAPDTAPRADRPANPKKLEELRQVATVLLPTHPFTLSQIADELETSTKQLAWFLHERIPLTLEQASALASVLDIRLDEYGYLHPDTPRVFVARDAKSAIAAYELAGYGGDLAYSNEISPSDGPEHSKLRYLLFQPHLDRLPCVMVFERGSTAEGLLAPQDGRLINRGPAVRVQPHLYARVCEEVGLTLILPRNQIANMTHFWATRSDFLEALEQNYRHRDLPRFKF